jgi:predicted Zn-dependent peptidase
VAGRRGGRAIRTLALVAALAPIAAVAAAAAPPTPAATTPVAAPAATPVAAPATTPPAGTPPSDPRALKFAPLTFAFPKPEIWKMPNGLTVYLLPDRELPVLDLSLMAHGGSIYDPAGKAGLAELATHLMRTGGTAALTPDAVDQRLEFLPASIDLDAADDALSADLSCVREAFPEALRILAGMLRAPRFDAERLEVERARRVESIRRRWDQPGSVAGLTFRGIVYGGDSPWARLDTLESIGAITRDDLAAWQKQYMRPTGMLLSVAGDFEPAAMKTLLKEAFGDWSGGAAALPAVPKVADTLRPGVYVIERGLPQSTIVLGHLGASRFDRDKFPLFLLNYILGEGGFSSRLMQEVRSVRGLVYSVSGGVGTDSDLGLFALQGRTRTGATAQAIEAIREVTKRLVEEGPTEEEIRNAKEARTNAFVFTVDGTAAYLKSHLYYRFYGYPEDYLVTWREKLQAVTREQIMQAAKRLVHTDRMAVVVVGDPKGFDKPLASLGLGEPAIIQPGETGAPAAAPAAAPSAPR